MSSNTNTFDPTKPVRTRGGQPARIVATDAKNQTGRPILALITDGEGNEGSACYHPNGRFNEGYATDADLVNTEPAKWVNVYRSGATIGPFDTRAGADEHHQGGIKASHYGKRLAVLEIPEVGDLRVHHEGFAE